MIMKLSRVFGKEVHTISGKRVGRVADVAIDVESRKASDILITNLDPEFQKKYELEGAKGIVFTYSGIKSIEDIVLVSDMKKRRNESEEGARSGEIEAPAILAE